MSMLQCSNRYRRGAEICDKVKLESLADVYATPPRGRADRDLKEATPLEADFWEMGWRAGQRIGYPRRRGTQSEWK